MDKTKMLNPNFKFIRRERMTRIGRCAGESEPVCRSGRITDSFKIVKTIPFLSGSNRPPRDFVLKDAMGIKKCDIII